MSPVKDLTKKFDTKTDIHSIVAFSAIAPSNKSMTLRPRVSEKAYGISQKLNTYVFNVPVGANKISVSKAVADQFGVTVEAVNILNSKGKSVRSVRRGGKASNGRRANTKKAYVTIATGDIIPIFAAEEAAEAKEAKKAEKAAKKLAKDNK